MFPDASFAGDLIDSKSTSGGFLFLMGPRTCIPLGHLVKKQGAVSNSSTEAEAIALDTCLRVDGLPALTLWEQVLEMFTKTKPKQTMKHPPLSTIDRFIHD